VAFTSGEVKEGVVKSKKKMELKKHKSERVARLRVIEAKIRELIEIVNEIIEITPDLKERVRLTKFHDVLNESLSRTLALIEKYDQ